MRKKYALNIRSRWERIFFFGNRVCAKPEYTVSLNLLIKHWIFRLLLLTISLFYSSRILINSKTIRGRCCCFELIEKHLKTCKNKGNNGPFDEDKIDDIVIERLGVAQTNLNNCCSLFIKICNSLRKKGALSSTESSAAAATAKWNALKITVLIKKMFKEESIFRFVWFEQLMNY